MGMMAKHAINGARSPTLRIFSSIRWYAMDLFRQRTRHLHRRRVVGIQERAVMLLHEENPPEIHGVVRHLHRVVNIQLHRRRRHFEAHRPTRVVVRERARVGDDAAGRLAEPNYRVPAVGKETHHGIYDDVEIHWPAVVQPEHLPVGDGHTRGSRGVLTRRRGRGGIPQSADDVEAARPEVLESDLAHVVIPVNLCDCHDD